MRAILNINELKKDEIRKTPYHKPGRFYILQSKSRYTEILERVKGIEPS